MTYVDWINIYIASFKMNNIFTFQLRIVDLVLIQMIFFIDSWFPEKRSLIVLCAEG